MVAPSPLLRREDRRERVHPGGDVGRRDAGLGGALLVAGHREQARFALHQQVVGLFRRIRTGRPVAGDPAPDERGMRLAQLRGAEPEPFDSARREVVQEDVRLLHQPGEDLLRLRVLHVQSQAFLRAVDPDEVRGEPFHRGVVRPCRVAAGRPLDLDDARAELGELAGGERSGDDLLERNHGDAFQRPHAKARLRPGKPVTSVRQASPRATGCASVSTPVLMISPGRSGASGCRFSSSTR